MKLAVVLVAAALTMVPLASATNMDPGGGGYPVCNAYHVGDVAWMYGYRGWSVYQCQWKDGITQWV